ncbi:Glutathione import ATP-binding protein GsiA [Propionibacterium australiense]|uniref:ABC transporter n=2 Tax=Propionibacterium australiense TaxID=119981 RepID=A0A383SAX4_9ACTN|nr:ATP-binding cassette domain-containing protein [Propionibacterium australiense]RLP06577.1 ATP-binding cassette domain-containing protein [Propionibacterium australiense]SYZ34376.1 ABC transporter [Propionibacterium australiense]VEH92061.1 Glutathione import ATP-binding protein GsiA [Propionibacterium australiense]
MTNSGPARDGLPGQDQADGTCLLSVRRMTVSYDGTPAVRDVSLDVTPGEVVAIVGESGSGKTTVIRAILGLLPSSGQVSSGDICFEDRSLLDLDRAQWLDLRRHRMSMVFQDTGAMLNPVRRIGSQFVEYIRTADPGSTREQARGRAETMLDRMALPDPRRVMDSYAFELSGGMRQRVGIAMAMTFNPALLLADEPTSALDVTMQAEIVRQMLALRRQEGTAIMIVTHNLGVAAHMADTIMVMRAGRVLELGPTDRVIDHPAHEYTASLLASMPSL